MKNKIRIGIMIMILVTVIGFNCDYGKKFDNDFKNHVKDTDIVLSDKDPLNPITMFIKNNKPIGFEFRSSPEFGDYTKQAFLNGDGQLEKMIIRKTYQNNIETPFDSIYVIKPLINKITVFTDQNTKGIEIQNPGLIQNELFNIEELYNKILSMNHKIQ